MEEFYDAPSHPLPHRILLRARRAARRLHGEFPELHGVARGAWRERAARAVAKFGVLDLYDRLADAQSAYAQAQQENRAAQEKLSHFDEVLSEYRTYSMEWMEDGEDSDLNFAVERTEMLDLIERTVMPYGTLSALQAQGDRVDVELNETDLDRIAEALSAVKASSIVESVGLELAETEKDRPADVMKCTLHIVLRGEAAE